MLGAPFGACTGCGNCGGSESRNVRPTFPGKRKSGRGSTLGVALVAAELVETAGRAIDAEAMNATSANAGATPRRLTFILISFFLQPRLVQSFERLQLESGS